MQRRTLFTYIVLSVIILVLAIGVGHVGAELDTYRIKSSDLQFGIEELESQVVGLTQERNELHERVSGQEEVITQLTHELYRANARARYAEEQERLIKISFKHNQEAVASD